MEVRKKKSEDIIRFVEGFVYILLIIITIIANTYGSIHLRLIPLLFLLGFIGKVLYSRPVVTSLFGGIFSIVTMYINGTYKINEILVASFGNLVLIALGEIFGICVVLTLKTINSKIRKRQSFRYVLITISFFVLSVFLTCYVNGNIFSYNKAENKLKEYLKSNYSDESFEITGYRYIPYVESGYSFKVKNKNGEGIYKFIVYDNNSAKIYDEYKTSLLILKNNNIKKYITRNNISNEFNISIDTEYLKYDAARLVIKYIVANENNYYEECANLFNNIIRKMSLYDNYSDIYEIEFVVLNLENENINTIFVDTKEYFKYAYNGCENEYILNLLNVDFFDF